MATIAELLQAALIHQNAGRYDLALPLLGQAIAIDPSRADAHLDLGDCLRRLGRLPEALASYEQALRLDLRLVPAHNCLGIVHQGRGDWDEAEACFRRAVQYGPDYPSPLNNLGTLLLLRGKLAEARTSLEQALRLKPDYAEALNNLGSVAFKFGQFAEAGACFARALALKPELAIAHYNLGAVFHKDGRLPDAEACFRQALRLNPGYAPAYQQLGAVLKDLFRLNEARACLEQALRLVPDDVETLGQLSTLQALQGETAEARASIARALAIRPVDALKVRAALFLPVIYESMEELRCERSRLQEDLARLATEPLAIEDPVVDVGLTAFFLAYQGMNDRDLLARLAAIHRRATPGLDDVAPHCQSRDAATGPAPEGPIRVGFISTFFYQHTIGKLNLGYLRHLSRDRFSVTLFRFPGPDDPLARSLQQAADRVVTLPRNLDLARRQIADERLDIFYYADIGMDPWTYFLAFARLAPVQCVAWGHPVTTGIPTIDYFLSSNHLEPEDADEHYTEELVRLDRINTYYHEPKIEGPVKSRAALGLGDDANLYVCAQSLFKVHPEFDAILGAILRGDPRGQVVLIAGQSEEWARLLADRFRRSFPGEANRVIFLPRLTQDDFLHLQARADVLLDTPHFGGGSTSYEAFAFGTPIVTRGGRQLRDRITYACYRQMGVEDCIAHSDEEYVNIALRLGTDPAWREQVRSRILDRKHLLYEDAAVVRELEQFFLGAVNRARGGTTSAAN